MAVGDVKIGIKVPQIHRHLANRVSTIDKDQDTMRLEQIGQLLDWVDDRGHRRDPVDHRQTDPRSVLQGLVVQNSLLNSIDDLLVRHRERYGHLDELNVLVSVAHVLGSLVYRAKAGRELENAVAGQELEAA